MKKLRNIHPGEILKEEFLAPLEITACKLSKDVGIPQTRFSAILIGLKRTIYEQQTQVFPHFLLAYFLWGHEPFGHAEQPRLDEHPNGRYCPPDWHRDVLWSCDRFFCDILSRLEVAEICTRKRNLQR
jgi:hypothetical protein